mgnify:CR=1 FL=1
MNKYTTHLDAFLGKCQVLVDEHMKQYSWEQKLTVTKGRKYDKIISEDMHDEERRNSRRVWAFVDKTNGDILKPESWKKPAKHARGNIYEDDCMLFVYHSGPAYMDTIKEYYGWSG